jgi:flagellar hook assembly protein FlgD
MSFNYQAIGSLHSVQNLNQNAKQAAQKQVDMSQKMLCAMLTNQVPGSETNMSDMLQMLLASTNAATQANSNELLEHNVRLNHAMFSTMMGQFQGQLVDHQGDAFDYKGAPQTIRYDYPDHAKTMQLAIVNEANQVVFSKVLESDENEFVWDGMSDQGDSVPHGLYKVAYQAFDDNMNEIEDDSLVWLQSKVTEVRFDQNNIPVLFANNLPVADIRGYRHVPLDIPYIAPRPLMVSQDVNTLA